MADYPALAADALEDDMILRIITDARAYGSYDSTKATAKYCAEWVSEIRGLIQGRVASRAYGQSYICGAGDAVGDPVYIVSAGTVSRALATDAVKSKIIGFIRWKNPLDATECKLDHYRLIDTLSGGTVGNPVYLTNAGGYAATPGKEPRVCGTFVDTNTAILHADPFTSQQTFANPAVRLFNSQNFY